VVQEAWLDALRNHEKFHGENIDGPLAAWLAIVVRSKARNALRRLRRRQAVSLDVSSADIVDGEAKEPGERMEQEERHEILIAAFEELREEEPLNARLVWERIMEGRSVQDLAAETGLKVHAITCRINRTKRKLRSRLRELGNELISPGQSNPKEKG
jgi:RNA polymerase sigma-70 factor (ECF subfamily)